MVSCKKGSVYLVEKNNILGLFLAIVLVAFLVWKLGIWGIVLFVFLGVWLKIVLGLFAIRKSKKRKRK